MTLIELLVALFIVSMMMLFLVPLFAGAMRARAGAERAAELGAAARGTFDLLRCDLQGAFKLASVTYDFDSERSFRWSAPVGTAFRRLTFVSATDGARNATDALGPYEYDQVSWFVRGGTLIRQVGRWSVSGEMTGGPPNWEVASSPGLQDGDNVYYNSGPLDSAGTYAGALHIKTDPANPTSVSYSLQVKDAAGNGLPVTVTIATSAGREHPDGTLHKALPGWMSEYTATGDTLTTDGSARTYALYCRVFGADDQVYLGSDDLGVDDSMYFVVIEPLWWSLAENVAGMDFRAPDGYEYDFGLVPEWVDVEIVFNDPEEPGDVTKRRRFGQRIAIPAGEGP